jgi:translocation and assembly module TamB
LRLGVAEIDRLLAGRSMVSVAASRDEAGIRLDAFDLSAASLRATGSGTLATAGSDISARVDFADLSVLGDSYGGRLQAEARVTGTPAEAVLALQGTGTDLRVGVAEADSLMRGASALVLDANLRDGGADVQRLEVRAQNLIATVTGRAAPENSSLLADLRLPDLSVLGRSYGGALTAKARFDGAPAAGRITVDGTGNALRIGNAQADRLLAGTSTLSAALRIEDGGIRVDRAEVRNPQVQATASGSVQGSDTAVTLDGRLNDLALLVPEFPGPVTLRGTARQSAKGTTLDLAGRGPGGIDATVRGTLAPGMSRADIAIAGRAQAALANVFISPTAVLGTATFDLRLAGPLAPASLSGRIALAGGRITGPDIPFSLTDIEATANLSGGRATIDGRGGVSTGGGLRVAGSIGLAAPFAADLSTDLLGVVVRDPQLYQTRGNGTVTLRGPLTGGATIGGRVALIESEVRIPDTGFAAVGSLPTLQHVGEPADVRRTRIFAGLLGDGTTAGRGGGSGAFGLDLEISHPNRLFVRGRGLDTELGGTLTLRGTTANIVPEGSFRLIRGRLDILGKRLTVSEADLRLEGNLVPSVEIIASNSSDGIVSFVRITGRIDAPEVDFASIPELPEEEVLSRLLFGRGIEKMSAFQAAQLASAIATLAGRGGEGILSRLRTGLGLDNFDVATTDDGSTSLTVGKYVSRNLYTEVEVDQGGRSEISLNLDVSESLTVRGRVDSEGESGLGLFFQRDY